jgi:hypothetical protein
VTRSSSSPQPTGAVPAHTTGTVVRVERPHIVVVHQTRHGGRYVEHYRCRDGIRDGGLGWAEPIQDDGVRPSREDDRRRRADLDSAYHEWRRRRDDVGRLRRLHEVIGECLDEPTARRSRTPSRGGGSGTTDVLHAESGFLYAGAVVLQRLGRPRCRPGRTALRRSTGRGSRLQRDPRPADDTGGRRVLRLGL